MLKANYLNMPGFKGDPNFITFEWEGQMMDDSRMLKDYGVRPESVIFHVDNKMGGTFAPMNYAKMAREFRGRSMESGYRGRSASRGGSMGRRARSLGDEYPRRSRSMGYGNQWQSNGYNRNSRFGGYHGYGGSYEDASSTSIARRAPGFGFAPEYRRPAYDWSYSHSGMPTRAIRQMNTMEVGRFNFRLMHRFEGRWQGEAIMMSSRSDMMSEPYRVSTEIEFYEAEGWWNECQTMQSGEGMGETHYMTYHPMADGRCWMEFGESFKDADVYMREDSENSMTITAVNHHTKKHMYVEHMTLMDDMRRLRTITRYSADGEFECFYWIQEQRVDGPTYAQGGYYGPFSSSSYGSFDDGRWGMMGGMNGRQGSRYGRNYSMSRGMYGGQYGMSGWGMGGGYGSDDGMYGRYGYDGMSGRGGGFGRDYSMSRDAMSRQGSMASRRGGSW
jgi:hypothetical protein